MEIQTIIQVLDQTIAGIHCNMYRHGAASCYIIRLGQKLGCQKIEKSNYLILIQRSKIKLSE